MNNLCMCSHISDEEEEDNGVCEAIVIYFLVRLECSKSCSREMCISMCYKFSHPPFPAPRPGHVVSLRKFSADFPY